MSNAIQQSRAQLNNDMESKLVQLMAKRRGIDPDEAKLYVDAFKKESTMTDFEQFFSGLALYGPAISKLPDPYSQNLMNMLAAKAIQSAPVMQNHQSNDDPLARIAIIKQALGDGNNNSELAAKLANLEKLIQEKEEKTQLKQFADSVASQIKALQDNFVSQNKVMREELDALKGGTQTPGHPQDIASNVVQQLSKVEETKQNLLKLMGIQQQVQPGGQMDIESAKQQLQRMGYKVQGPMTAFEFEQQLEKHRQEMTAQFATQIEEVRTKAREEAMADTERQKMLITFGMHALDAISSLVAPGEAGKAMTALKGLLKGGAGAVAQMTGKTGVAEAIAEQVAESTAVPVP